MDNYVPYKIRVHKKAFRKKCLLIFLKLVFLYTFIHQFVFKIVKVSDNFSLEISKGSYGFVFSYHPKMSFSPQKGDIILVKILTLKATWIELFLKFFSLGTIKEREWSKYNNTYRFYKILGVSGDKISFLDGGKSFKIISSQDQKDVVIYDFPFQSYILRDLLEDITLEKDQYFVVLTGAKKEQAVHYGEVVSYDQIVGKMLFKF